MPFAIDISFSHFIQSFDPPWLTTILKLISTVTAPALLTVIAFVYIGIFYKKITFQTKLWVVLLSAGNGLTLLLKNIFSRPRPTSDIVHVLVKETDFSFPSGHALGVILFASILLILFYKKAELKRHWLIWISTLLVILVCYSRLYLGVHWLTDVLGGIGISLIWVALCYFAIKKIYPRFFSRYDKTPLS